MLHNILIRKYIQLICQQAYSVFPPIDKLASSLQRASLMNVQGFEHTSRRETNSLVWIIKIIRSGKRRYCVKSELSRNRLIKMIKEKYNKNNLVIINKILWRNSEDITCQFVRFFIIVLAVRDGINERNVARHSGSVEWVSLFLYFYFFKDTHVRLNIN